MHATFEFLQEAARSGTPVPFSVAQLGKALITLPLLSAVTAVVTVRAALRLKAVSPPSAAEARSRIDLSLAWGALTFGAGMLHMLMSFISTSWSVQLYGPIGQDQQWLVARGVMLGLIAGAYGLAVLLLTALAWLGLRRWSGKLAPTAA